jgi:hypothetical protein
LRSKDFDHWPISVTNLSVVSWELGRLVHYFTTMALSKFFKREESTPVADLPASNLGDIEKDGPVSYADGDHQHTQIHIDPAVEKRLIRKLDRNVVPLVMALCMIP